MRSMTAVDATRDWRKLADEAQRAPLRVVDEAGNGVVVLSEGEYRRIRGETRDRLKAALARMHEEVAQSGASDAEIEALIASDQP